MFKPLKNFKLPDSYQNKFGALRKYDIHTGVDLFCNPLDNVYSIENGIVINTGPFTGIKANSPWWNDTNFILIQGEYNILYGEIETSYKIGDSIKGGQIIGRVLTVLKKDKGLPLTMLHIEQYNLGYNRSGEIWNLNSSKPKQLINITKLLKLL